MMFSFTSNAINHKIYVFISNFAPSGSVSHSVSLFSVCYKDINALRAERFKSHNFCDYNKLPSKMWFGPLCNEC